MNQKQQQKKKKEIVCYLDVGAVMFARHVPRISLLSLEKWTTALTVATATKSTNKTNNFTSIIIPNQTQIIATTTAAIEIANITLIYSIFVEICSVLFVLFYLGAQRIYVSIAIKFQMYLKRWSCEILIQCWARLLVSSFPSYWIGFMWTYAVQS